MTMHFGEGIASAMCVRGNESAGATPADSRYMKPDRCKKEET